MPVPVGSPGDRLLESLGYGVRWRSWVLVLPPGVEVVDLPTPQLAAGNDPTYVGRIRAD